MTRVLSQHAALVAAGEALGRLLGPGDAVALEGPMGAGKTTLVQGIASGLNVAGEVTSPTFALMNVYPGRCKVYHLDLYRLDDGRRLPLLGYEEEEAQSGVTLVEWAEKLNVFWTDDVLRIRLSFEGTGRRLEAEPAGAHSAQVIGAWDKALQAGM